MPTLEQKLWDNVDKGEPDECWEWTAGKVTDGYGRLHFEGQQLNAHRVSAQFEYGDLGDKWVLHHCDNPACVNPNHLYLGDRADNMRDAVERSEWPSYNQGEDSGNAKLTESDVIDIKKQYKSGRATQTELAQKYDITQPNVSDIVRGVRWSHVVVD